MLIKGIADSRYELTFRLKSQNSPSSGLIAMKKSWIHTCIQQRLNWYDSHPLPEPQNAIA